MMKYLTGKFSSIILIITFIIFNGIATKDILALEITPNRQTKDLFRSQSNREGKFTVNYVPVRNPAYRGLQTLFADSGAFVTIADGLNKIFILPSDITITLAECGQANAFYSPQHQGIVICYELIAENAKFATEYTTSTREQRRATFSSTLFVFFHELAHALIHVYDLPVVGREEDAADQLAILISTETGDFGEQMAIIPAIQYLQNFQNQPNSNVPYWGQHSLDIQRYYNIICMLYGSDPNKYSNLATLAGLPGQRAKRCPGEYQQAFKSWATLLKPHTQEDFFW